MIISLLNFIKVDMWLITWAGTSNQDIQSLTKDIASVTAKICFIGMDSILLVVLSRLVKGKRIYSYDRKKQLMITELQAD